MANYLYQSYKASRATESPSIKLNTDTINCCLVASYTNANTHQFLSDVTNASGVICSTVTLTISSTTNGVVKAANSVFTAVAAGSPCQLVVYKATGVNTNSPLIAFYDTGSGLPVTPVGVDINTNWDQTNGIFSF